MGETVSLSGYHQSSVLKFKVSRGRNVERNHHLWEKELDNLEDLRSQEIGMYRARRPGVSVFVNVGRNKAYRYFRELASFTHECT